MLWNIYKNLPNLGTEVKLRGTHDWDRSSTYTSKGHLLLPVPFHLHVQMFNQPGLLSAVLSHIPGFSGPWAVLGWHPHSWYRAFWNCFASSCCQLGQLTSSLCFGKRFNPQWNPWGALEKLRAPSPPFSFLSWVLYSAILCLWICLYV